MQGFSFLQHSQTPFQEKRLIFAMLPSTFTLPPEQFAQVFPFHILLDAQMGIVQVGATLQRLCPCMRIGQPLADVCKVERPLIGNLSLDRVTEFAQSPFILNLLATGMRLKGQMLALPASQQIVFLGTPWITDLSEMEPLGLSLSDFALHDALTDFLLLVQSKNAALADTQKLAQTLGRQREKLRQANQKLEAQYALMRILTAATTTQGAALQILQTICTATGWEVGVLWAVEQTTQVLCCVDQWYANSAVGTDGFQRLTGEAAIQCGEALPGTAWAQRQSTWRTNIHLTSEDTDTSSLCAREQAGIEAGFCSALAVPILSNGDMLGVLEFYSRTPPTEAVVMELIETLAHQIGQFLERKHR